jgi:hypothetical protein
MGIGVEKKRCCDDFQYLVTMSRACINLDIDLQFRRDIWFRRYHLIPPIQTHFNCRPSIVEALELSINPVHCQKP